MSLPKVIVIVGATATGKSKLAVRLARRVGGEIISADSRQIYKGIDQGSGKIEEREMREVPHHLLSVANPKKQFSVADYQRLASRAIAEILKRGKTPIIVGGTGFYVDAVTKGLVLPAVPPNKKLREQLNNKTTTELATELTRLDPERAKTIDLKNKVRLIRAIEIAKHLGKVPRLKAKSPAHEFLKIGLSVPAEALKRKIRLRLRKRLRTGMAIEIYTLHQKGVPWKRFHELGFDQRYTAMFLQGKLTEKEMLAELLKNNWKYAKRQLTWFKRDSEIKWFDARKYGEILRYVMEKMK